MKDTKSKIFKRMVICFFMISPIFDMVFLYNHVTTALRVGILLGFVAYIFFTEAESHKSFGKLFLFYVSMLGYLGISVLHSKGFETLIEGGISYSVVAEATTLLKLGMPFTILFILKFSKLEKKDFSYVIFAWIVIISGSILVSNLLGYSLSSYTNEITRYNIFSWGSGLSVNDTATKGFFTYANQVSITSLSLMCLMFYEIVVSEKGNIFRNGSLFVVCISMWMIGTRLATYGGLLVLVALIILYVVVSIIKKRLSIKKLVGPTVILLLWIVLIPIMPSSSRLDEIANAKNETSSYSIGRLDETSESGDTFGDSQVKDSELEYIEKNINRATIGRQFYMDYYPYKYDMDFWMGIVEAQQEGVYIDYRKLELMIAKRLFEVDDRWSDVLFGISNSRLQSVTNVERDFVLQYFAFGVVGSLITLSFYLVTFLLVVKRTLRDFSLWNMVVISCLGLFLLGSFMTGNSLNFLATNIPIAFILGYALQYI